VSKPEVNQELPHFALFERGLSESTEGVEANLAATHIFQDGLETVSIESAWPRHFSCLHFKQKAALSVADDLAESPTGTYQDSASRTDSRMGDAISSTYKPSPAALARAVGQGWGTPIYI